MSRTAAVHIIARLRDRGHVAYLAGGCVRDRLLGLGPTDHDVATDATPAEVQKIFRRSRPVGEAFGVVLVHVGHGVDRVSVEVATFRTEGVYSDGRHPDAVAFSDAEHDSQRRDFTVNGLFENPGELTPRLADDQRSPLDPQDAPPRSSALITRTLSDGSVILDYVGGLADLASQTLRAIGEPGRRFAEDYLRMLRAVRFATRLNFTLDPATAQAIRGHADRLDAISRERIGGEVRAMLTGSKPGGRPAAAAAMLQQLKLDGPTLQEDASDLPLPTLMQLDPAANFPGALAAWMIDRYGQESVTSKVVSRWRKALCLSNDETDTLRRVFKQLDAARGWPTMSTAARKRLLSATDWDQTLLILRARAGATLIDASLPTLRDDGTGLNPRPLIDGRDLIASGLPPGPRFKTLLDGVYDAQLTGEVSTREQALAWVGHHAG